MTAVGFDIQKVVDDVGCRGAQAETEKGDDGVYDERQAQCMGQQHGHEDQDVLCPLVQPDSLQEGLGKRCAVVEAPCDGNPVFLEQALQSEIGIGNHGFTGMAEQGKIGARVADVVKAVLRKTLLEALKLVVPGEVRGSVAGQHLFEDAEVSGDTASEAAVRSGRQVKLAAEAVLFREVFEQLAVVGKVRRIQLNLRAHAGFQARLSALQPERGAQGAQRVRPNEQQKRIDQSVALDEGSVEINADGALRCCWNVVLNQGLAHR